MKSSSQEVGSHEGKKKYKGIRRRKWGKWVSEIRVPGTTNRLWLGSYSNPEAAAIAYDTAMFYLRGPSSVTHLNFPNCLPNFLQTNMSPKSIQRAATNAAMAIDFELAKRAQEVKEDAMPLLLETQIFEDRDDIPGMYEGEAFNNISVDDIEIYLC
ncbi:ethylene-responsive transcription factor ERF019-like [Telopea speciosissima]|uniref:ethylene-responsive transcription factor ERF019-like n=1 Tax=Telopea speciosissima TaxID=54955 RepID=UPI001CC5CAED|nr:ethylene-responsive transcription factor ERF019-like [Telopea speciosissima]